MNGYNQVCLSGTITGEIRHYNDSSQNPKLVFMVKNGCTSFYVETLVQNELKLEPGDRVLIMGSLFGRKIGDRYMIGIRAETIVFWPENVPQLPQREVSILAS